MSLVTFDLEISEPMSQGVYEGQGIACAATAAAGAVRHFFNVPRMTPGDCATLVRNLMDEVDKGNKIVTWNGCNFDFRVLAHNSGMLNECILLNRHHYDLMFQFFCIYGYPLGMEKALTAIGLHKVKTVELSDGNIIVGMEGARAPELWNQGETAAVQKYLQGDVESLLTLATRVSVEQIMRWRSKSGADKIAQMGPLLTVDECLELPLPDTSWMQGTKLSRQGFTEWMKEMAK